MRIHPGFIGIDVSKHHLDIFDGLYDTHRRVDNTAEAIEAWLAGLGERQLFVVFEATGRFDRTLARALAGHALRFARVNPSRARDFARSLGLIAKTDAIDARMLAAMGSASIRRPRRRPTRRVTGSPAYTSAATSWSPFASRKSFVLPRPMSASGRAWSATLPG
ncbi:transposase [Breoghania sp. L-A4]|uniref:IS110 family transposase n=1 Tax=Breoghania sp. L-A4 TaxID=2304600 RepID=UPI0020BF36EA|nr:transposase [Breoghania sp. L-A4]